jgi:hypothetical protein
VIRRLTAAGLSAAALFGAPLVVRALPPPDEPRGKPSPVASAAVDPTAPLPAGSPLYFVFDEKLSSAKAQPGQVIRLHLRDALVVNGVLLAPAGTPASLTVVGTRHAQQADEDGAVEIHLEPLVLPGKGVLPVRPVREYLTIDRSGGQIATRGTEDVIGSIFIPNYQLYQYFRHGQEYVLPPGAVLRALTSASIDATNPKAIVIATPPPMVKTTDPPYADYTPIPLYTAQLPTPRPTPRPKPTPTPTPKPSPTPSPSPSPGTSTAPSAPAAPTGSPSPAS